MKNKIVGIIVLFGVFILFMYSVGRRSDEIGILGVIIAGISLYMVGFFVSGVSYGLYQWKPNRYTYWILCVLLIFGSFSAYGVALQQGYDEAYQTIFYGVELFLAALTMIGFYYFVFEERMMQLSIETKKHRP